MKKIILLTIAFLMIEGSAFAKEYWVDNSRENETMSAIGTGTEKDPYNMTETLEKIVLPGDIINLIGTNKPYTGGISGKGLKSWIFGKCTVVKHETFQNKVVFVVTRKIPISALTGITTTKTIELKEFNSQSHRFYQDGTNLVKVSKDFLGNKVDAGFSYDDKTSIATIDTDILPVKPTVTAEPIDIKPVEVTR